MTTRHARKSERPRERWALRAASSAVTIASFGVICTSSAGPVRQGAGLILIGAFACAIWLHIHRRLHHQKRFDAIVPATGLTLAFLILAGLALAAVHALSTVPVALALGVATLAAAWAGTALFPSPTPTPAPAPAPAPAERRARPKPPNPLAFTGSFIGALIGVLAFAAAAVLAVHYSAASAKADTDAASSVAIWAYPEGDQLHVGVEQPAGHSAASLRIVVTRAGVTVATWNDIRLTAGQTWEAPALTLAGDAPAHVVALSGETVVASLSSR
jgi:hypothetical protein